MPHTTIRTWITSITLVLFFTGCAPATTPDDGNSKTPQPNTPSITLSASANSIPYDGTVMLSWTSSEVFDCNAVGDWAGPKSVSGQENMDSLLVSSTFQMVCDSDSGLVSDSVTVNVETSSTPVLTFSASPDNVPYNGSTILEWSSNNVSECVATGDWSGSKNLSGSKTFSALTTDQTFTLNCSGAAGSITQTVNVLVAVPGAPSVSLTASPISVAYNGSTRLTWTSENVDTCLASGNWSGSKNLSGGKTKSSLTSDKVYTLTCTGAGGSSSSTVNVSVADPLPEVSLTASPSVVADNGSTTLVWSSSNTTSCTASGDWSGDQSTSGTQAITGITAESTFGITCSGSGGDISDSVTVTISNTNYVCTDTNTLCVDDTAGSNQEYTSIQSAIDAASAGDTVVVFDGNYAGFRVDKDGTSNNRITIVANGSNVNITSSEPYGNNPVRIDNASYITINGFNIDRSGASSSSNYDYACIAARGANVTSPMESLSFLNNTLLNCNPGGMYLSNVNQLTIRGNVVDGSTGGSDQGMGIYIANAAADNAHILENIIINNSGNGIHFNGDSSVGGDGIQTGHLIEKNIIMDNGQNGLNMDGVQSVLFQNNIFVRNDRHAIRGYRIDGAQGPEDFIIVNNTFFDNTSSPAKATEDRGGHIIFNNIVIDNGENFFNIETANFLSSNNLISTDESAVFTDAASDDYRLKSTSDAVNAGLSTFQAIDAPTTDIADSVRSGLPDQGAFETGSDYPIWY